MSLVRQVPMIDLEKMEPVYDWWSQIEWELSKQGMNDEFFFFPPLGYGWWGDTYSHRMKKGLLAIEPTIYCDQ